MSEEMGTTAVGCGWVWEWGPIRMCLLGDAPMRGHRKGKGLGHSRLGSRKPFFSGSMIYSAKLISYLTNQVINQAVVFFAASPHHTCCKFSNFFQNS